MHKYHAKSITIDGIKFGSQLEARFYRYFKDKGIKILELQPRFLLQEGFRYEGKAIRAIEYIADFLIEHEGDRIVVDAKGMELPVFSLKYKLWLKRYGKENIIIVAKSIKDLENKLVSL